MKIVDMFSHRNGKDILKLTHYRRFRPPGDGQRVPGGDPTPFSPLRKESLTA